MCRELSAYLGLLRFSAAVAVFFSHIGWTILTGGFLWQLQFIGADAVIVFFVLSGFMIQYAADTKEKRLSITKWPARVYNHPAGMIPHCQHYPHRDRAVVRHRASKAGVAHALLTAVGQTA
jgi:hypothetical protein